MNTLSLPVLRATSWRIDSRESRALDLHGLQVTPNCDFRQRGTEVYASQPNDLSLRRHIGAVSH